MYAPELCEQLADMLSRKNGFFAFESALHVFPAAHVELGYGLAAWNSQALWRGAYGDLAEGYLFFAEDIFGEQFALRGQSICRFQPETGEAQPVAEGLDEWATLLLANYQEETGWPMAHEWQRTHGPLQPGHRLIPKTPFVLGGEYSLENLSSQDAVRGMESRAHVARQIRDLPEGTKVRLKVVDSDTSDG